MFVVGCGRYLGLQDCGQRGVWCGVLQFLDVYMDELLAIHEDAEAYECADGFDGGV